MPCCLTRRLASRSGSFARVAPHAGSGSLDALPPVDLPETLMPAGVSDVADDDDEWIDALHRVGNTASDPDTPPRTGPIKVGWMPRLQHNHSEVGTCRCMLCDWTFAGPLAEGMAQHLAHRTAEHPKLAAVSSRHKGQRRKSQSIKQSVADREGRRAEMLASMEAELAKGPCSSSQLAAATGLTKLAATTTLNWAQRKGETRAVLNPSVPGYPNGVWSLEALPPGPGIGDIIEELRKGPRTAQELAAVTGLFSPIKVGTMLGRAVKRGEVAAHSERLNGAKRWVLDEEQVEVESG